MAGPGRRTTGSANSSAGSGVNLVYASNSVGPTRPEPAVSSVTEVSAAVASRLPVPPPFTNSRLVMASIRRIASARRALSSGTERAWMNLISRARTGCPGGASPRPAICPS
jgi:hypothetical protein